mmetsp:Transcript_42967/g.134803  ORF Transcript_42967/g.134803 Transcript_42967/m.134803 type:complete len:270 (+) Transcript_42967:280-1089(+)
MRRVGLRSDDSWRSRRWAGSNVRASLPWRRRCATWSGRPFAPTHAKGSSRRTWPCRPAAGGTCSGTSCSSLPGRSRRRRHRSSGLPASSPCASLTAGAGPSASGAGSAGLPRPSRWTLSAPIPSPGFNAAASSECARKGAPRSSSTRSGRPGIKAPGQRSSTILARRSAGAPRRRSHTRTARHRARSRGRATTARETTASPTRPVGRGRRKTSHAFASTSRMRSTASRGASHAGCSAGMRRTACPSSTASMACRGTRPMTPSSRWVARR